MVDGWGTRNDYWYRALIMLGTALVVDLTDSVVDYMRLVSQRTHYRRVFIFLTFVWQMVFPTFCAYRIVIAIRLSVTIQLTTCALDYVASRSGFCDLNFYIVEIINFKYGSIVWDGLKVNKKERKRSFDFFMNNISGFLFWNLWNLVHPLCSRLVWINGDV